MIEFGKLNQFGMYILKLNLSSKLNPTIFQSFWGLCSGFQTIFRAKNTRSYVSCRRFWKLKLAHGAVPGNR